jgi:hypothetical protein
MTLLKSAALGAIVLMTTAVVSAQQHFPLRSGEWAASVPDPSGPNKAPFVMLYCLNDELWTKALTQNPSCSISQFNVAFGGGSYYLTCTMKTVQMKGNVKLTFDGMTHMVANASLDTTAGGKTTHTDSTSDYRWKGPTCNPNTDMNLKFNHAH